MDNGYDALPTERDETLARRLAEGPADRTLENLGEEDARLLRVIDDWAEAARNVPVDAGISTRLWTAVSEAASTDTPVYPGRRPVMMRLVRHPVLRYAAAAVVVGFMAWTALRPSDEWRQVAVASASAATVTTADGSMVTLRPNSVLYQRRDSDRAYRLVGEGLFDVVHDDRAPFTVEGGKSLVTVLGTRFNLATWGDAPSVYLAEGRVRFEDRSTTKAVDLEPGQGAVLDADGPAVRDAGAEDDALDWTTGALSLASRPLSAVLAEIEQHYGIAVEVPEALAGDPLTGRVILGDVEQTLVDLGTVVGGRFLRVGPSQYRLEW